MESLQAQILQLNESIAQLQTNKGDMETVLAGIEGQTGEMFDFMRETSEGALEVNNRTLDRMVRQKANAQSAVDLFQDVDHVAKADDVLTFFSNVDDKLKMSRDQLIFKSDADLVKYQKIIGNTYIDKTQKLKLILGRPLL